MTMRNTNPKKPTIQELEAPKVDLTVDTSRIDRDPDKERPMGRAYPTSRSSMPEDQLFELAEYRPQDAERTGYSNYSYWRSVWANFLKRKSAVIMLIIFILLFAFTFVGSWIGRYPWNMQTNQANSYIPAFKSINASPEGYAKTKLSSLYETNPHAAVEQARRLPEDQRVNELLGRGSWSRVIGGFYWNNDFWFGTDGVGMDYWARCWYATRASILLAVGVSSAQILLGLIIGLVWGYVRKADRFFTELYNLIDNIPTIIYMTLIALLVGKSLWTIGGAMVLFGWLGTARNVRNLVFMYRDREYNLASRCLGTGLWRILARNIFPYLISVIILRLALAIPTTIAYETTLTYLGLMDITEPSLGNLLRDAKDRFMEYPHLLIFPAVIVSIITITFYLVGNAFSDASDPRNHV